MLLDCFGEVVEVGLSYPRVLGYTPGRRREMRTAELIHPGDLDGWRQAWSELMTRPGKRKSVALRARHTDGRWCSMEVTLF
ncbi:MAG: PAS domain-containing protein, partial [Actinomycetota bacterium]|nr:PAS domain-containing protein [Actinomycetota bacterium]